MKNENEGKLLRILSIEDSLLDADLVKEYLNLNSTYEVQMDIVSQRKDFIALITENKYDIILSDFMLPDLDGFEVLQIAKDTCPTTPIICLSGCIGEETAVELLKQGATDYVSKDKLGRLIFSIDRALRETEEIKDRLYANSNLIRANHELEVQNTKITYLYFHDLLTGLYNRSFFEEEKKRLDTPRQLPISILMGDINGLKLINDGFGHLKGDELLIEISKILKSCCREEDIVARIGGDEFAILLPKTSSQDAQLLCNRITEACKISGPVGNEIYPSISIGYATKTKSEDSITDTFMLAEESMAKRKLLESKSAHNSLISSIKVIMLEKSQETELHTERLGNFSRQIGVVLSLTDDQLNDLELFSLLHDIGKMSVRDGILSKPGELSPDEWIEVRRHPEAGFRIAQASTELVPIANYILCHHERWDGKGYPQGLSKEQIPLLSRILAVVDAYDAMTNARVYRPAMTKSEAITEIEMNSGTQFDPNIVEIFLNLLLTQTF